MSALTTSVSPSLLRTESLVAAAKAFIGVPEQGGENRGQMVEIFLRGVGLEAPEPWCAAFVHHVGFWSQWDPETGHSMWPLPATGACQTLAEAARERGVLLEQPMRGDLFVMWFSELGRFAHTGVILDVEETGTAYACRTIEGNTTDDGSREGWKTAIRYRHFTKGGRDRFIRWVGIGAGVATRRVV